MKVKLSDEQIRKNVLHNLKKMKEYYPGWKGKQPYTDRLEFAIEILEDNILEIPFEDQWYQKLIKKKLK